MGMSNVVEFPRVNGAYASGNSVGHPSIDALTVTAWSNYFRGEIADGASRDLARARADSFIEHRFGSLIEDLRKIMGDG